VNVGPDETEAERRRLEKQAELASVEYVEPSRDRFELLCEEWWSNVAEGTYAETTRKDCRSMLDRHIIPAFGMKRIAQVRYREIQQFIRMKQQEKLSNKRINNILVVISRIFDYGVRAEVCRDNPVSKVDRLSIERHEVDCLSPQELWSLLQAVREVQPYWAALVVTALMTGMRLGELRSLTWKHVDLDNRVLRVRKSKSKSEVKGPKTAAGWRTIPLSPLVVDALIKQREREHLGCDLVFPSHRLTPFDPANVRNHVLYKALDHAKLRRVTWHSLRHSAASLMAASGANEKQVQEILGHSSIMVTKDLYTHLFPEAKRDAIDRMTDLMNSVKPKGAEESQAVYLAA